MFLSFIFITKGMLVHRSKPKITDQPSILNMLPTSFTLLIVDTNCNNDNCNNKIAANIY